jgi:methylated-DNA-[protein]-cysteine S-methyltransferase
LVDFLDHAEINYSLHAFTDALDQLDGYFSGKLKVFDLELDLRGTAFQMSVWREILKIPVGETDTYINIARRLGNENQARAVGNATAKNPVPILIPCHRVIGVNGNLLGYGGGLWRKEWLLEHERKYKQLKLFK